MIILSSNKSIIFCLFFNQSGVLCSRIWNLMCHFCRIRVDRRHNRKFRARSALNTKTALTLAVSHLVVAAVGFAAGIYALPILIAPNAPTTEEVKAASAQVQFTAEFKRELKDSDALHWGEGTVSIGSSAISLVGKLSPGPDYKLYLSPEFVETESDFKRLKSTMIRVGDVKTFNNFVVPVPASIDPAKYSAVIVWCETFSEFITSAKYR